MENLIKYTGWLLAVVLLVVCALLWRNKGIEREVETALREVSAVPANPDESLLRELEVVRSEKAALEKELAALKAAAAAASPVPEEPLPPVEPAPTTGLEDDAQGMDNDAVADAQVGILADVLYQELFDELALDPETRAAVKDLIAAHLLASQREMMAAMAAGDQTGKAARERMDALKAALREELAGTLTPEQLAAWDDYESVADQLLYERTVDGQLTMMAPGLSGENRVLASQVMAEELVREFDALGQSEELYTRDNFNAAQLRALNASLDRLAGDLDEEQLGYVRGFVEQASRMFEAMSAQ